jgi:hypothetical protein
MRTTLREPTHRRWLELWLGIIDESDGFRLKFVRSPKEDGQTRDPATSKA